MKITITTPGDSSVGIQGECITIDWPGLAPDPEEREGIRLMLAHSWRDLLGERVTVEFEDECGECGRPGRKQGFGCPYVDCPDNSDAAERLAPAPA